MKLHTFILLILLLITCSSCLQNDFDDPDTVFNLSVTLDENDDFFEIQDDRLRVLSVRFVLDNIELEAIGENEKFESDPRHVLLNNLGLQNEVAVGSGEIFGGNYTGVSFRFSRFPSGDNLIVDEELVERDDSGEILKRYSYAITGIFNNKSFKIKSDQIKKVTFSFARNIEMPPKLGVLDVNLLAEWKEWFQATGRKSLLDPFNESDRKNIKENFEKFFTARSVIVGER